MRRHAYQNRWLPAYLTTNDDSCCFRMRVPHNRTNAIGQRALKFSLGTDIFLAARTEVLIGGKLMPKPVQVDKESSSYGYAY